MYNDCLGPLANATFAAEIADVEDVPGVIAVLAVKAVPLSGSVVVVEEAAQKTVLGVVAAVATPMQCLQQCPL